MSRYYRSGILFLALALLLVPARAPAQVPLISQISPQPTSAGTPTSRITILGSNFGNSSDTVTFPGNPVQVVSPTAWMSGYLEVPVPSTWSGTIYVFSGSPSPDEPFEVSYNWGGEKWLSLPFTWLLNQNGAPGVPIADVSWALNVAYDAWECTSDLNHSYGGLTVLDGSNHYDGNNVQYWSTTPWADPGIIAVATYTYNGTTHEIYEADIHYNGADWSWSAGGSATTVDIQHIATHESGHTIGLLDLYGAVDNQKTMYGFAGNNVTFARTLTEDDIEGAEYLYPHAGRCNYTWATPSGWWGPIVPRVTNDATQTYAPLPSSLPAAWEIYVNWGEANNGLDCANPQSAMLCYLDDVQVASWGWTGQFAVGAVEGHVNYPVTVPNGRHTFRVEYDPYDDLIESNENDNTCRSQFAWSPFGLADQHPEVRPAPPPYGTLTYPNCEGFMFTGNWWGGVAITPTANNDDYDLRLFDDYFGSTTGYQSPLVRSEQGTDKTDIVLVNGNIVGYGETRWAGIVEYNPLSGGNVVIQQSNQVGNTHNPGTTYGSSATTGPRILALNQIFKVHEFALNDNSVTYEFELVNQSGGADLELAVFDAQVDYHALSDAVAASTSGFGGEDESLTYQPPVSGYYGVVVYKRDSLDLPLAATYELICRVAPPNLDAHDVPTGHDNPLVPRNTTGASSGNVHVTTILDGNAPTTYLSYAVEQEGPNDSPQWETRAALDGENVLDFAWSGEPVPPTSVQWFNRGPYDVRGGRHTLILNADPADDVSESDEGDNIWIGQYVWSPLVLTLGMPALREVPPYLGIQAFYNCDGMTF
ncbi:MAG: matrixin family metalloprotease, partial [bacterium]